jgi:hypothetical protein
MVFEVDEVRREGMVVDDFICGLGEEEIEMSVVFMVKLLVD